MIFQKDGDKFLASLAIKNNVDMDKILSAYLILGENVSLILHIFEGCDLHIPSERKLGNGTLHNIKFIEDDARKYSDYKKGEYINLEDKSYKVVAPEKKILNHWYVPVIEEE